MIYSQHKFKKIEIARKCNKSTNFERMVNSHLSALLQAKYANCSLRKKMHETLKRNAKLPSSYFLPGLHARFLLTFLNNYSCNIAGPAYLAEQEKRSTVSIV